MKKTILLAVLLTTTLSGACRGPALVQQTHVAVRDQQSDRSVRSAVIRAMDRCGWAAKSDDPGVIVAELLVGGGRYRSEIRISYDAQDVKIDYVDSDNLEYSAEEGTISRHHAKWVAKLRKSVSSELGRKASAARVAGADVGDPIVRLQEVIAADPTDAGARISLAARFKSRGDHDRSRETLLDGARWIEGEVYATFLAGLVPTSALEAEQYARKVLAIDAQSPTGLWSLAQALELRGQRTEALTTYERLIAVDPYWPWAHYRLAHLQLELGRPAEAVHSLEEALVRALDADGELPPTIVESLEGIYALSESHAAASYRLGSLSSRDSASRVRVHAEATTLDAQSLPRAIDERPYWGVSFAASRLLVAEVHAGSIGALAGVVPGDELLEVNGMAVSSESDLDRSTVSAGEGDSISVLVKRKGTQLVLTGKIQTRLSAIEEGRRLWREGLTASTDGRNVVGRDLLEKAAAHIGDHNMTLQRQRLLIRAFAGDRSGALSSALATRERETFHDPDFWVLIGLLHKEVGDEKAELESYRRASSEDPAIGEYVAREGLVHFNAGRVDLARERQTRAQLLLGEGGPQTQLTDALAKRDVEVKVRAAAAPRARSNKPSFWGRVMGGVATQLLTGGRRTSGGYTPVVGASHIDYTTQSLR